jgi:hypothetical protein
MMSSISYQSRLPVGTRTSFEDEQNCVGSVVDIPYFLVVVFFLSIISCHIIVETAIVALRFKRRTK